MLGVIHRRFPDRLLSKLVPNSVPTIPTCILVICVHEGSLICSHFLRKSLKDLMSLRKAEGKNPNAPRLFWNWLARQEWRCMLPKIWEYFGLNLMNKSHMTLPLTKLCCIRTHVWSQDFSSDGGPSTSFVQCLCSCPLKCFSSFLRC